MKRIIFATTLMTCQMAFSQEAPSLESEQGRTLPDYISQIAEADEISPIEYHNMANGTLQVADTVRQQGQPFPESAITDALNAVAAGRELSPDFPDWDSVEQRLLEHLNPPDQQQTQDQQNSDQNSENQEGEENQQQQGQSGDQQGDSQEEQSQESQEGQQEQDGEQQGDPSQDDQNQDGQSGEQGEDGQEAPQPPSQDGAQMGELDESQEEQEVQLDSQDESQQQPEQMQTLGGQKTTGEPIQAEQAAIRQMLEQLKQQDEPGKLFKILQEAQQGERKKSQPNAKDW